jgi:hypothetical protein
VPNQKNKASETNFYAIAGTKLIMQNHPVASILRSARYELKKSDRELLYGEKLSDARPVKCQKCGKPLGYVTVLAKGLTSLQQPLQNAKLVAICIECVQNKK